VLANPDRAAPGADDSSTFEPQEASAPRKLSGIRPGRVPLTLHSRTLPEIGTSVDHLFVGANGVFVIDLVHVPDADVSVSRTGGRFAGGTEMLTVGGSRATHLVDAVHEQCAEVAAGLADHGQGAVPVTPVLCFVEAQLPRRARNRSFATCGSQMR